MLFRNQFLCGFLCICLLLTGCGFQPLYSPEGKKTTQKKLQSIRVEVIPNRTGQQLRNYLIDMLVPKRRKCSATYRLKIGLSGSSRNLGFRRDNTPRHSELTMTANIQLIEIESGKVLLRETRKALVSYSQGSQAAQGAFSARTASTDTQKRAVKLLAEDIKLLLGGFLSLNTIRDHSKVDSDEEAL